MKLDRVAVVGLGLIGGSVGGALRRQGSYVLGFDVSGDALRAAAARGFIDEPAASLPVLVENVHAVVLAVPVLSIVDLLPTIDSLTPSGALIIDAGSVKQPVVDAMAVLPNGDRAIGGHPLAGSERSGPEAADPDLLAGRPFVLTPATWTTRATIDRAQSLVRHLGAQPMMMDAERHDRLLARTSHLPQVLSTVLAASLEPEDVQAAGAGLRDMTRLASSDVRMWRDILLSNRRNVVVEVQRYMNHLEDLVRVVETGDSRQIETLMRQGQAMSTRVKERVPV